jgi:hypothetical protein
VVGLDWVGSSGRREQRTVTIEAPKGITLTVDCAIAWAARLSSPKAVREPIWTIVKDDQRDSAEEQEKIVGAGGLGSRASRR